MRSSACSTARGSGWPPCPMIPKRSDVAAGCGLPFRRLSDQAQGHLVGRGDDGVVRFYGFAHSTAAPDLVAYVGLARDPMFADADRLFLRRMALSASAFVLAGLAAFWFGTYAVRRPIMKLRTAMQRVAAGDLSVRAEVASGIEEFANSRRRSTKWRTSDGTRRSSSDRAARAQPSHEEQLRRGTVDRIPNLEPCERSGGIQTRLRGAACGIVQGVHAARRGQLASRRSAC